MKKNIVVMCVLISISSLVFGQKDMFLLIGQSNMSGRAPIEAIDTATLKLVSLLNDKGKFEPAKNPLNRFSTIENSSSQRLGPGYTFARTLQSYYEDTVLLVVNAKGGTAIESWLKGASAGYYEKTVEKINVARQAAPDAQLRAIIWHQGESNDSNYDRYLSRLRKMVNDFRTDFGIPDLPFIAGDLGQWNGDRTGIRKQIAMIPDSIPNAWLVSSEGLKNIDEHHFDSRSQRTLGRRYALKYIQAQSGVTIQATDTIVCTGTVVRDKSETGDYWLDNKQSFLALETDGGTTVLDVSICENQSYRNYSEPGSYEWVEITQFGCNNYFELNLAVLPVDTLHIDTVLTDVDEYMGYTASGSYWRKYISSNGCDSLVNFNLTFEKNVVTGISTSAPVVLEHSGLPAFYVQNNRVHFPRAGDFIGYALLIYNLGGGVVYRGNVDEESIPLRNGLYVFCFTGNKTTSTVKILVQ